MASLLAAFLYVSAASLLAQTSPFLIVKESDYASLRALASGAQSQPLLVRMRQDAAAVAGYNVGTGTVQSRAQNLNRVMDALALSYILEANQSTRNTYRNRFYDLLDYWDLSKPNNIPKDLEVSEWYSSVPPGAAFFHTVLAMDVFYNDPNTTAAQITKRSNFIAMMEQDGPHGAMGVARYYAYAGMNNMRKSTQTITVTAGTYTLSFKGTGKITLSGAAANAVSNKTLQGTGAETFVSATYTLAAGQLTLTQEKQVHYPVFQSGSTVTAWNTAAAATNNRLSESLNVQSGTQYTFSVSGAGTVRLFHGSSATPFHTITRVNADPRNVHTFTASSSSVRFHSSGTLQDPQLELGAVATAFDPSISQGIPHKNLFGNTGYFTHHFSAHAAARGIWLLWKRVASDDLRLRDAVATYQESWSDFITDDGVFREYSGYGLARAGDPSRNHKNGFGDVMVYTGLDPDWYQEPRLVNFYDWLASSTFMPNRYTWPIGDTGYNGYDLTYFSPFDRAGLYSKTAADYAEWLRGNIQPPPKFLSFLARARTTTPPVARQPESRIFPDGGAFLRQKDGGADALATVLTNLKPVATPPISGYGHIHKQTNSLNIASFGEVMLRGPGYNGWDSSASWAKNYGYQFLYVNNHSLSQNVAMFNYQNNAVLSATEQKNPPWSTNHPRKLGGLGVRGLLSDGLDYASGDSGPANAAQAPITNGRHVRHVVTIYPQNGINGYVYSMDELTGTSNGHGQLIWHPYSASLNVNADNSGDSLYEWTIRKRANQVDQTYLAIYLPTPTTTRRLYNGLFADDININNAVDVTNSFEGRYLFASYAVSQNVTRNVLTTFFPRKNAQARPIMTRLATTGAGAAAQGASFAFASGVTDFAFESDGANERTLASPTLDPTGAVGRGKMVIYRKIANGSDLDLAFYFVAQGRSFKNTPSGFTRGFVSNVDVDLHVRGSQGTLVNAAPATITFYQPGEFLVKANGTTLPSLQSGVGFTQVAIPAGNHTLSFTPISGASTNLFGHLTVTGATTNATPANPVNLLANPGFETGEAAPWTLSNTSRMTIESPGARSGNFGLQIVSGAGGVGVSTSVTLKRNVAYRLSAWGLKGAANTNAWLSINGAGASEITAPFSDPSITAWQQPVSTFTPTAGSGATKAVTVGAWFSSGSPGSLRLDDFELYELPTGNIELGTRFRTERFTRITALRVWHPAGGPTSYTLSLWNDTGVRLAQTTATANVAGWIVAPLTTPVDLLPGRVYTITYTVPAGFAYQSTPGGGAPASPFITPVSGGAGVYSTAGGTFPTQSVGDTHFWADIDYEFQLSPTAPSDAVIARFTDGEGSSGPQQFPGTLGDGWLGGWATSASIAGTTEVTAPLNDGGPYLRLARSAGTSDQQGIVRRWSSEVRPLDEFKRITFDVRLDSSATVFTAYGDSLTITDRPGTTLGSGGDARFYIRLIGGAVGSLQAREWGVYSGNTDNTTFSDNNFVPSGVVCVPGVTYSFTVDVYAADSPGTTAGKTHGTYDVTISYRDPDTQQIITRTVPGSRFRSNTAFGSGGHLSFSTQQNAATDNLAFSVDTIEIAPLTASLPPEQQVWREDHFTSDELGDTDLETTLWGDSADPDRDGHSNLLEYALDTDPRAGDGSLVTSVLATRGGLEGEPEPVLTLTFRRARADLDYIVEGSFDLNATTWQTIATNPGSVGATVTVEDVEPADGQRFLRLRVVKP